MENERELVDQRLGQWVASMQEFRLPDWDSLPQLELYMDQVITYLERMFAPMRPAQAVPGASELGR